MKIFLLGIGLLFESTLASGAANVEQELSLQVVSSRPNSVSGEQALVQLRGKTAGRWTAQLNGHDVTGLFKPDGSGTSTALLSGLLYGDNNITLRVNGVTKNSQVLTDHPIGGPIFSGPHQDPFYCQTEAAGLGTPIDRDCNAKPTVTYFYRSADAPSSADLEDKDLASYVESMKTLLSPLDHSCAVEPCGLFRYLGFKPYDPSEPRPKDVAQVTTSEGRQVDFIVRRERGTINRAIYDIYSLHDPNQPLSTPWVRGAGWNGRLVYAFGGGCDQGGGHHQGVPSLPSPNPVVILEQGFALATSSLNIGAINCNDVLSAETLSMVKEHFVKEFGAPVHTIGWGASGGAIQQYLIAQNYPGLLDGIIPIMSYPDAVTTVYPTSECVLLDHVFNTSRLSWTDEQKAAVSGYDSWSVCSGQAVPGGSGWMAEAFWIVPGRCDVSAEASVPLDIIYNKESNPHGLRCDLFDNQPNIWGRDPHTGLAHRAVDNTGVQYGLVALEAGKINMDQFLDLNDRIGGFDSDGHVTATRATANEKAIRTAYQSGRVNSGSGGLAHIPIIDMRIYLDDKSDTHDSVRSLVVRARLLKASGRADNQVILTFPFTRWRDIFVSPNSTLSVHERDVLHDMDKWLDQIAQDRSPGIDLDRIARNRPSVLRDSCWTSNGERIEEPQVEGESGRCQELFPTHGDLRMAAGMPISEDVLKCALRPIARSEYPSNATVEQLSRLKQIFPQGVCDYSQPGIGQSLTAGTWQQYD